MLIAEHDDGTETREATISYIRWEEYGNPWKRLYMSTGEIWKGEVGDVVPGTLLRARGREEKHKKWGVAFNVEEVEAAVLDTGKGFVSWMAYTLPQVGDERAQTMLDLFGDDLPDIVKKHPQQLTRIPGINEERAKAISEMYIEKEDELLVTSMLADNGLKFPLAMKAYNKYGRDLSEIIDTNPYQLMSVRGITFAKLDPVCLHMGIDERDPRRVCAYAMFMLKEELQKGNCYMLRDVLVEYISRWGIPFDDVLVMLMDSPGLIIRDNEILLAEIELSESIVASRILTMLKEKDPLLKEEPHLPNWLDPEQKKAALAMLTAPISIMTGGPGTGKTTTLLAAMNAMEARGERIACAAPTGKAAKRMSQVCNREASTIHRLLRWKGEDCWEHNATNPLKANVVVIDEASMIDIHLAASLFNALGASRLVLVGDSDQLPPVGPGQLLHDLIQSNKIPTYRLTTIHRQKGESWVVDNACRIIEGLMPDLAETPDFEFGSFEDSDSIIQAAVHLVKNFPEIQILSPQKDTGAGTVILNRTIQEKTNPNVGCDQYIPANNYRIYKGDKVLYTRNNYDIGLVNGDMGRVINIYTKTIVDARGKVHENNYVVVEFDGTYNPNHQNGYFELTGAEAQPLMLAYALTVHKAQGSEWPFVCVVADPAHWFLGRQLLYTAITRAYERLAIIGSIEAIQRAVRRPRDTNRLTLLQQRLTAGEIE